MSRLGMMSAAALAITLLGAGNAWAAPELKVVDPLTYRLRDTTASKMPLTVFATEGGLRKLRIQIRDPKGPGGIALRPEVLTVTAVADTVTTQGTRVELAVDAASFTTAGEYGATLAIEAERVDGTPVALHKTLTLIREKAEPDLEPIKDAVIRVYRWGPGAYAFGARTIELVNNGPGSLQALNIHPRPVISKDGRQLSATLLKIQRADGKSEAIEVAPGNAITLRLLVRGEGTPGAYTTGLVLHSPSLERATSVSLGLEVSDRWLLPFLAILFGVLTAFFVGFVADRWRPLQEDKLRAATITADVERRRQVTFALARIQELERIESLLRRAEDRLDVGDRTGARTQLDEADRALEALRKAETEALANAWKRVATLRDRLAALPRLDEAQTRTANEVRAVVGNAEALLGVRRVDEAVERLTEAERKAETLPAALPPAVAADARRQGREAPGLDAAPVAPAAPSLTITVVEPPEFHSADRELTFGVEDRGGVAGDGDVFVWAFGDGTTQETAAREITHRFAAAGHLLVRVALRRNGAAVQSAAASIDIAPGAALKQKTRYVAWILRSDVALAIISIGVASVTGLSALYFGKVFGTGQDYAAAFLWGVGIDASIRGFAAVAKKLQPGT